MTRGIVSITALLAFGAQAQNGHLDHDRIEQIALEELRATRTPGAAIAVISGDRVIFSHGFGVSSVDTGAPVSPDMLFRLGSTTKMFTASAVVGLALEGKIDLDAPVSRYIPGLDSAIGALTANQLLSHTSGIRDEAPMFGSHDESALGAGIRAWKADFLFAPPGLIYSYSNPAFWLAGFLAETVSGKPYADVMDERIFRPLGMSRTTLRPTMAMTWPLAQGHEIQNGRPAVIRPAADNAASWPAGSIFSSALDLSRFVITFLNDGRLDGHQVLSPKLIAALSTAHSQVPGSDSSYGYGLSLSTSRGVRWVQHAGSRAGYGSLIRMAPAQRFAVIIVANRTASDLPKLADEVCEEMLPLQPKTPRPEETHPLNTAEIDRYEGVYANGVNKISLKNDHGVLMGSAGSAAVRFQRAGNGFLMGDSNRGAEPQRIVLVPDAGGRIEFLFTGGRAYRRLQ